MAIGTSPVERRPDSVDDAALHLRFEHRQAHRLSHVAKRGDLLFVAGFAVTRDGRVIFAHWDRRDSNIMAIDQ